MKEINIQIPTSWNDLSHHQLKNISWYLHKGFTGKKLQLLVFFSLLNIKWYQFLKLRKALIVLKNIPLTELVQHFKFIFTKTDLVKFISIKKSFALGRVGMALNKPADRLGNITIDELAHADDAYLKYHNTKNMEYLRFLAAVLYRETGKYDLRYPFIKDEINARMKKLKKLDDKTLITIMRSYQGSRDYIVNKYPVIFPKPKTQNSNPKTKNQKPPTSSQFAKIILDLTGGKFGTYKETSSTNAYLFLADFSNKIIQQQKAS